MDNINKDSSDDSEFQQLRHQHRRGRQGRRGRQQSQESQEDNFDQVQKNKKSEQVEKLAQEKKPENGKQGRHRRWRLRLFRQRAHGQEDLGSNHDRNDSHSKPSSCSPIRTNSETSSDFSDDRSSYCSHSRSPAQRRNSNYQNSNGKNAHSYHHQSRRHSHLESEKSDFPLNQDENCYQPCVKPHIKVSKGNNYNNENRDQENIPLLSSVPSMTTYTTPAVTSFASNFKNATEDSFQPDVIEFGDFASESLDSSQHPNVEEGTNLGVFSRRKRESITGIRKSIRRASKWFGVDDNPHIGIAVRRGRQEKKSDSSFSMTVLDQGIPAPTFSGANNDRELMKLTWFHGRISSETAYYRLKRDSDSYHKSGLFLVRQNTRCENILMMTCHGRVWSFRISENEEKGYQLGSGPHFDKLSTLADYYKIEQGGLPCRLNDGISRQQGDFKVP